MVQAVNDFDSITISLAGTILIDTKAVQLQINKIIPEIIIKYFFITSTAPSS